MEGPANGVAVLNATSNNYDRVICFDAPVEMDTGLYSYERKTLAQARSEIISALGFIDPLSYTRTRTLAEMRADIARRLGWAAQVAAGSYPAGASDLLDSYLNEAQQDIFSRLELDNGAVAAPPRMVVATDVPGIDYTPVLNLAVGMAKAHYGQADAKLYLELAERYIGDVGRRRPPMLTSTINSFIRSAQEQLYFRYDMLRTERWWAWQTTAGRNIYDVPIDCTKFLDFRKITGAWIADNGGRALRAWVASSASYVDGEYVMPSIPNGFEYVVSNATAHASGATEPTWPTTAGGTFIEASGLTYTAVAAASSRMLPMRQGINPGDFNSPGHATPYNFELREYLELWPVPDKAYVVWLKGHMGLRTLDADNAVLTLDFQPVFLKALHMARVEYKKDPGTLVRDLEILLAKLTGASHGVKRYIPNPVPPVNWLSPEWDGPMMPMPRVTWAR